MKIELKKNVLSAIENFLMELKLSGKVSRARIKLSRAIGEAIQELQEDVTHIKRECVDDTEEERKQIDSLLKEDAVLDLTKYKALMNELYLHLDVIDIEFDGKDGFVHDILLDAIEDAQTKNGDDE